MSAQDDHHPEEFHAGDWDADARRPVVDGKIEDPVTGAVHAAGASQIPGPPSVDLVIANLYDGSFGVHRASRSFPFETLLAHIMAVVASRQIKLHSVTATAYTITVVLAADLQSQGGFEAVADKLANGVWDSMKTT